MTNCYLVINEESDEVIVIDPADYAERIISKVNDMKKTVKAILLTHGHYDHMGAVAQMKELTGADVYVHECEQQLLMDPQMNMSGMFGEPVSLKADVRLKDGQELTLAGCQIRVLHTPGHTRGSASYYLEECSALLSGDTLFCESVGRSDLPTGSMSALVRSCREKLLVLPGDTAVYPGHGPETTIAHEAKYNPFL